MARKKRGAFRTISEVSKWLDTPTHVLRFWESKFDGIEPVKRAGGRRYYRPEDLELIGGVKVLLHDQGKSIASVLEMIEDDGEDAVKARSPDLNFETARKPRKASIKNDLDDDADDASPAESEEAPAKQSTADTTLNLGEAQKIDETPKVSEPEEPNEPSAESQDALQLEEAFVVDPNPPAAASDVLRLTPEASARQKIDQSLGKAATQARNTDGVLKLTVDDAATAKNLDDIEELYFDLQMMRNRIRRALQAL